MASAAQPRRYRRRHVASHTTTCAAAAQQEALDSPTRSGPARSPDAAPRIPASKPNGACHLPGTRANSPTHPSTHCDKYSPRKCALGRKYIVPRGPMRQEAVCVACARGGIRPGTSPSQRRQSTHNHGLAPRASPQVPQANLRGRCHQAFGAEASDARQAMRGKRCASTDTLSVNGKPSMPRRSPTSARCPRARRPSASVASALHNRVCPHPAQGISLRAAVRPTAMCEARLRNAVQHRRRRRRKRHDRSG